MSRIRGTYQLTGFFWGKIFSNKLFENRIFPLRYWFEDTCNLTIFPLSNRTYVIPNMLYCYRINLDSISHSANTNYKKIDTLWVSLKMMSEYIKEFNVIDKKYLDYVFNQAIMNYGRMQYFDEYTKQCVFVITREFIDGINSENLNSISRKNLYKIFKKNDYGYYKLYMKTHCI